MTSTEHVLQILRDTTRGTQYDGKLFLVGGFVRDKAMGVSLSDDIDIVLEGDALGLAIFLFDQGVTTYKPVVYPRFGTAMVMVGGRDIELVTARIESYSPDSRKPDAVQPGTIQDDVLRRDFTINTLLENLHTGELTDPTGKAFADIASGIIRTPAAPKLTFTDDPLRMMRAVRFAARFGFTIEPETWRAIQEAAPRLEIISRERIRDEFCKTLLTERSAQGMELFKESGLLAHFVPELLTMVGVTQNEFHSHPVWEHTMAAVSELPKDAPLVLKLAVLFHDIGKPGTRSEDPDKRVHFYGHQDLSAKMTRRIMNRLKFSNDEITVVTRLVQQHMRIGEYKPAWTDAAVRRLIRDLGPSLNDLFAVHRADVGALAADHRDMSRAVELRDRIGEIQDREDVTTLTSPLDGLEIMRLASRPAGKWVGRSKILTSEVIEGRLAADDKVRAAEIVKQYTLENL